MRIRTNAFNPELSLLKFLLLSLVVLCSCTANNNSQQLSPPNPGATNSPTDKTAQPVKTHEGEASVYSDKLEGKKTASGKPFSQNELTAASKEHPLGSKLKVTAKETGKSTTVTVTDRGPYAKGRIIDLSKTAAKEIGVPDDGVGHVKVEKVQ